MYHLELDQDAQGDQLPHCFLYSPRCGKCKKNARVRFSKKLNLEGIPAIEILFQCDRCKLQWRLGALMTKKQIQEYGPKRMTEDSRAEVTE